MNWKEQFDKQFRDKETNFQGSPVEYTIEVWNAEHLDDLKKQNFYDFISSEVIEKLIEEIPDEHTLGRTPQTPVESDNRLTVDMRPLKQQLREKWLIN